MYIDPQWRILTIGDGDLSFSASLRQHYRPAQLTATIFDNFQTLSDKYGAANFHRLSNQGCKVLTAFDVTKPQSWSGLALQQFDAIIFQFPLLPGSSSHSEFNQHGQHSGVNTRNRRLLRTFLLNSFNHFLDRQGPQLCLITSKDVKPYREWNIENSLTLGTSINYLGAMPFNGEQFPNYKIRNVDRDKFVKNTLGITYVWSMKKPTATAIADVVKNLSPAQYQGDNHCAMCRVGPFGNEQDRNSHQQSKRHLKMAAFEQLWLNDLAAKVRG